MKLAEAKMNLILNNRIEKQDWSYYKEDNDSRENESNDD